VTARKAPDWATAPFTRFLDQAERLGQILEISMRGIMAITVIPDAIQFLARAGSEDSAITEAKLEKARVEAELADSEAKKGFPVLHAQAVVTLWSYLEALARSFATEWLRNRPDAIQNPVVSRLKAKIGEYEMLSAQERPSYIFDLLEQELGTNLRSGINRVETLLAPFGLSGDVPDDIQRDIFEMGQIRNVLVHRGGIADRRFVDCCPWLGTSAGMKCLCRGRSFKSICIRCTGMWCYSSCV